MFLIKKNRRFFSFFWIRLNFSSYLSNLKLHPDTRFAGFIFTVHVLRTKTTVPKTTRQYTNNSEQIHACILLLLRVYISPKYLIIIKCKRYRRFPYITL